MSAETWFVQLHCQPLYAPHCQIYKASSIARCYGLFLFLLHQFKSLFHTELLDCIYFYLRNFKISTFVQNYRSIQEDIAVPEQKHSLIFTTDWFAKIPQSHCLQHYSNLQLTTRKGSLTRTSVSAVYTYYHINQSLKSS